MAEVDILGMQKNYLVILQTAMNPNPEIVTSFGEERLRQYIEGFEKIYELSGKYREFDFVISDNTITPDWKMPKELEKIISKIDGIRKIFFYENELAVKNKGCGVLAGLKKVVEKIDMSGYSYCIYFEPRQLLLNFKFFDNFLKKPANYFKYEKYRVTASTKPALIRLFFKIFPFYRKQFNVGLFSLETRTFCDYVKKTDLQYLADNRISMEEDMLKLKKRVKIEEVGELGIMWRNSFNNENVVY